ncbi:hypothetical protein ACFYT4_28170 [Streptomyces sp. NPDC004609]|uniref:COG4315 family predicted lipoprotein n=1 Tax=Streptomyces sp. NPDC004609 TaxID=3364704 RepID=UPI00369AE08D
MISPTSVSSRRRGTNARAAVAGATLVAVLAGGCSDGGGGSSASESPSGSSAAPASSPTSSAPGAVRGRSEVTTRSGPLGRHLVDGGGRTLYLFEADASHESTCTGDCAKEWPPMTAEGASPSPGSEVTGELLGTTDRADGTKQVTYNGHPLYYYVGDKEPGDITGEGSRAFGAEWYIVDPDGNKIPVGASKNPDTPPSPGATTGTPGGGY